MPKSKAHLIGDARSKGLHRRFSVGVLNQAFSAASNNLSSALLVKKAESAHAQPKLDAIHGAELVRSIVRLGGPTGIIEMHADSQSWRIEQIQLTLAAANWFL